MKSVSKCVNWLCLVATMLFVACDKPTPENPPVENPPVEQSVNSYVLDGEEYALQSVALTNLGEYLCIVASTDEGVVAFDDFFVDHDYIYIAISPLLEGESFNLMEEQRLYTVMSTLPSAAIEELTPSNTSSISMGDCLFAYDGIKASVSLNLTLADGRVLSVRLEAEQNIVVNSNVIVRNGEEKPVRTAFHRAAEGKTSLYFTPAGVDYYADMVELATWYIFLELDDSLCDGRVYNLADVEGVFCAGLRDNVDSSLNIDISSQNLGGASGSFMVRRESGEREYTVVLDIVWGAETLTMEYAGAMLDADMVEVRNNEIVLDGKSYAISSASLNRADAEIWELTLRCKAVQLTIIMPAEFYDGRAVGFSTDARVGVMCNGELLNKANGYSGTIFVTLDGDNVEAEFINNSRVSAYYRGVFAEE